MTTMIEKSLANMANMRDRLAAKIDKLSNITTKPSAFVDIGPDATLNEMIIATRADLLSRAAERLRVLHESGDDHDSAPLNPFGKPATGCVIDGEFTELKSKE